MKNTKAFEERKRRVAKMVRELAKLYPSPSMALHYGNE